MSLYIDQGRFLRFSTVYGTTVYGTIHFASIMFWENMTKTLVSCSAKGTK